MLTVTAPALDRTLLSIEELRSAAAVAGGGSDADLRPIGDRVAAAIARYCELAGDGVSPLTFRRETLSQTIRLERPVSRLFLARRPIAEIVSVVENGFTLAPLDFDVYAGAGFLARVRNDALAAWPRGKIVVEYKAGFEEVPDDLKLAASKLVRLYWSERNRDPLVRQENIPGVLETTYWIGSIGDGALPPDICELLSPYRNSPL